MGEYTASPGAFDASALRIAIVAARFNDDIVHRLVDGAQTALADHGVTGGQAPLFWVPGAFELPLAARHLARSFDAVICLGAVVRGETTHFEHISREAASGIARVALDSGVPIVFGVLTTEDRAQALSRTGGADGHKGVEAAETAIEMAHLVRRLAASDLVEGN